MGKRRGRTGPGGAVVSSLSSNAGGTTTSKRGGQRRREDPELAELANPSKGQGKKKGADSSGASNAQGSLSAPSASAKWLGKSPQQMLREWCIKNNRIRPYFQRMAGDTGIMRCTIPQGRKDGKKAKGNAFDRIVGVGDHPGEEYAALNVLHQVERGKPLERLLAPEYRNVWLDLDKRFTEMQGEQERRAEVKERRKEQAERRAKFEKSKESATINISAASRQMIEDALLEHKASGSSATASSNGNPILKESGAQPRGRQSVQNELISMGFTELDAVDASQRFNTVTNALDYLCLNLDESELPSSFAPTADVEVVQFYSGTGSQRRGRVDPRSRDILTGMLCLSKHAAEKALRVTEGKMENALIHLYNTLTHNLLPVNLFSSREDEIMLLAQEEKRIEEETITAIYADDAVVGIGALHEIPDRWAVVVKVLDGLPAVGYKDPLSVAIVDVDGMYPFSAPAVIVGHESGNFDAHCDAKRASLRRVLMRAAAGEVASLRESFLAGESGPEGQPSPVPVVYGVLSFLGDATQKDLTSSASRKAAKTASVLDLARQEIGNTVASAVPKVTQGTTTQVSIPRRRNEKPRLVDALKPSKELAAMQARRAALPAHNARTEILAKVRRSQVVVVSGATGSGKTTQVPQFLLEEAANSREPISIVCTQPRRIAAISVAERVADERCQRIGESVGYQVKLNSKRSAQTRLLFCTTGVLLRRLQGDPQLENLTHVLVDEVHERSVETDFLLLLLREIVVQRPKLRVILMSATVNARKFSDYFSSALARRSKDVAVPVVSIPGRTFPVDEFYLEEAVHLSQYRLRTGERFAKRTGKTVHKGKYGMEPPANVEWPQPRKSASALVGAEEVALDDEREGANEETKTNDLKDWDADYEEAEHLSATQVISVGDRLSPEARETVSVIDEAVVNVDLIDKLVKRIDADGRRKREEGAVLVFLPGIAEISGVIRKLSSGPGSHALWPLPLHSLLSPDDQSKVFSRPPKGKRKVICATNIAETSITVDDVTVVIDSLRAKEMSYDALNRSSVLEECFISKAAAKQRAGRAGRVSKGTCYRLVRRNTFETRIAAQQAPEIQRVALEHLVLHLLSIIPEEQSNNDPQMFLGKAVDPPKPDAVTTAISTLVDIGALKHRVNGDGLRSQQVELTALGRHLTGLPVDARIGKLLIFGSIFSCVDAALTIAATITERSPFYAPFDKREEARAARLPFVWGKSDLLTFVKAFDAWRDLRESRLGFAAENEFCTKHFLSRKTLLSIGDARRQLADSLSDAGFGLPGAARSVRNWERNDAVNQHSSNVRVLKAVVCAALYPNVARIDMPDATYHEVAGGAIANEHQARELKLRAKGGERLFLHPESVNFEQGKYETRWLAYFAKVKTSKLFIRDSTMVSPYAILLFGGEIAVQHKKGQMSVDRWVVFKAPARVAVLARELRRELDGLLMRKFEDSDINVNEEGRAINDAIIRLITLES